MEALRRAIVLHPRDDTPRLMYADKLDELGGDKNTRYAEFIRLQIAIANRTGDSECCTPRCVTDYHLCEKHEKQRKEGDREEALWGRWPECDDVRGQIFDRLPVSDDKPWWALPDSTWYASPDRPFAVVSRGFVDRIVVSSDFFKCRDSVRFVFSQNPILSVVFGSKTPRKWDEPDSRYTWQRDMSDIPNTTGWGYYPDHAEGSGQAVHSVIPGFLFDKMPRDVGRPGGWYFVVGKYGDWRYDSKSDADAALSAACVLHGRELAGLLSVEKDNT